MNKLIFLLFLLASHNIQAAINFREHENTSENIPLPKKPLNPAIKVKTKKIDQYHVEGYANEKYVRFVVEVMDNQIVGGQMLGKNGDSSSISGEFVNNTLHIYDSNGGHFTVIVP